MTIKDGNAVTIKDGNFSNNSASSDGGVIHLEQQNSDNIGNSTLNFNSAGVSGGALYSLLQNKMTITGNSFYWKSGPQWWSNTCQ